MSYLDRVQACNRLDLSHQLPFLINGRATLDSTAGLIDAALALDQRVLVHCEEGSERTPLVVAWFLHTRRKMSLEAAYNLLKRKRPIVRDRRKWLERFIN